MLNTDWSLIGISFAVLQKICECEDKTNIRCCKTGWVLVYCNSRFCTLAESRYSPVAGEALAVPWGLMKAKYLLLGARDLHVAVDHKPLLGLYRPDKCLSDIGNMILLNLVEKTLRFRFTAFHVPGIQNQATYCMSRYPVGPPVQLELLSLGIRLPVAEEEDS